MKLKRIGLLSAFLAVLMLCLSACASKNPTIPQGTSGTTDSTTDTTPEPPTEEPDDPLSPDFDPSELDFEEEEIRILQYEYQKSEFEATEGGMGDMLEQAVYSRNQQVETDLNIRFKFPTVAVNKQTPDQLFKAVENSIRAEDPSSMYHLVAQPSYYVTGIMVAGYYLNLGAIENSYVNLEKQYWLQSYVDASAINDRYYFLTGMPCTSILNRMEVVYVNNALANDYFPETDVRNLVYDGGWTYGKMLEMIAVTGDGAGTGTYGMTMAVNSLSIDGLLCAMELSMVKMNDSGIPVVNINTQHNTDIIEKLRDLYYHNESALVTGNPTKAFAEKKAIFLLTLMMDVSRVYNSGIEYTLIPMPKYDDKQGDYVVSAHDEYSILSVCANVENAQMLTAVLEDLAYRSADTTYQATYIKTYSHRYAGNPENSKMFDFLFNHLNFSVGYIYSYVLGDCKNTPRNLIYPSTITNIPVNVNSGIGSSFEALEKNMESKMEDFIDFFFGKQ